MNLVAMMVAAKNLILNKSNWTKGMLARDKCGNAVCPESKEACQFCAMGALDRIIKKEEAGPVNANFLRKELHRAAQRMGRNSAIAVNDACEHSDVMKMFDEAIATLPADVPV